MRNIADEEEPIEASQKECKQDNGEKEKGWDHNEEQREEAKKEQGHA